MLVMTNNSVNFKIGEWRGEVTGEHQSNNNNGNHISVLLIRILKYAKNNHGNRNERQNCNSKTSTTRCNQGSSRHVQPSFNGHECYQNNRDGNKVGGALAPTVDIVVRSTFLLTTLGFATYISVGEAKKGWAMSPVHKSVNANPLRRLWNAVRTNVFFQIAAKINAFPITATGDKIAITKKVAIENVNSVVGLCGGEDVVLLDMAKLWWRDWRECEMKRRCFKFPLQESNLSVDRLSSCLFSITIVIFLIFWLVYFFFRIFLFLGHSEFSVLSSSQIALYKSVLFNAVLYSRISLIHYRSCR